MMMRHVHIVSELQLPWLRRFGVLVLPRRLLRLLARRKALDHLRNLPDHLLKDIGLSRFDVVFPDAGPFDRDAAERKGSSVRADPDSAEPSRASARSLFPEPFA